MNTVGRDVIPSSSENNSAGNENPRRYNNDNEPSCDDFKNNNTFSGNEKTSEIHENGASVNGGTSHLNEGTSEDEGSSDDDKGTSDDEGTSGNETSDDDNDPSDDNNDTSDDDNETPDDDNDPSNEDDKEIPNEDKSSWENRGTSRDKVSHKGTTDEDLKCNMRKEANCLSQNKYPNLNCAKDGGENRSVRRVVNKEFIWLSYGFFFGIGLLLAVKILPELFVFHSVQR